MTQPLYRLLLSGQTAELITGLHPHLKKKIKAALQSIIKEPFCGKALRDELKGLHSFRVSNFRIVYRIAAGHVIEVIAIGPRRLIYEETFRLIGRGK